MIVRPYRYSSATSSRNRTVHRYTVRIRRGHRYERLAKSTSMSRLASSLLQGFSDDSVLDSLLNKRRESQSTSFHRYPKHRDLEEKMIIVDPEHGVM